MPKSIAKFICWVIGHDWREVRRDKLITDKKNFYGSTTILFGVCRRCGWAEQL